MNAPLLSSGTDAPTLKSCPELRKLCPVKQDLRIALDKRSAARYTRIAPASELRWGVRSNQPDDALPAELARTVWALHRALRQRQGAPTGETPRPPAQVEVLRLVSEQPGTSVRELADALRMQANNVSTLVSRLANDGYLERRPHPGDGRQVRLYPTAKMRAAAQELATRLDAGVSEALEGLGEQARARIAAALPDLHELTQMLSPRA
ncbi:MarR family winged helix-turn-helix transcriptional regulator [Nocardia sp. CA-151230]|uniref:MarR family winged helix-turn-helix transcriptional regulator n=1 Tax=Nocardia sp. CA-151230 TaxID=3239982 RepID=UPI003D8DAD3E